MTTDQLALSVLQQTNELVIIVDGRTNQPVVTSQALRRHLGEDVQALVEFLGHPHHGQAAYPQLTTAFNCQLVESQAVMDNIFLYRFVSEKQQTAEMHLFIDAMKTMQEVVVRLSRYDQPDELFYHAVNEARAHLYFDRLGFMLIDCEHDEVFGSWGTDRHGQVVKQSDYHGKMSYFEWLSPILDPKVMHVFQPDVALYDDGQKVGTGWNLAVAIWDGERVLGWIACDNLLTQQPLAEWQRELFVQFGRVMGHLYAKCQYEHDLRRHNDELEAQVERRSRELAEQYELLRRSQEELVNNEKLATLGSLVAGVAHEVNTPLGICVTAASHLETEAKVIQQAYDEQTMTRSGLERFINTAVEASDIITGNIDRASELIYSFKRFTADQTSDFKDTFDVHELIDHIIRSFRHRVKNRGIVLENLTPKHLLACSYPSHVSQILSNLLNNSLVHGFDNGRQGRVSLAAHCENQQLILTVADDGKGIEPEHLPHIFQPFYTTKRAEGGTGLGLNVIYNLTKRLSGAVSAQAQSPSGVKFTVTLPLEEP